MLDVNFFDQIRIGLATADDGPVDPVDLEAAIDMGDE